MKYSALRRIELTRKHSNLLVAGVYIGSFVLGIAAISSGWMFLARIGLLISSVMHGIFARDVTTFWMTITAPLWHFGVSENGWHWRVMIGFLAAPIMALWLAIDLVAFVTQ